VAGKAGAGKVGAAKVVLNHVQAATAGITQTEEADNMSARMRIRDEE
jgi:hypothetical protein